MRWLKTTRADQDGRVLADRHYTRQKPGSPQFVQPGRALVLITEDLKALWVTSWPFADYVKHEWAGAWQCSMFRNEGPHLSSELILEAVAATRYYYQDAIPEHGFITFVNAGKVRQKRDPGYCYLMAGFKRIGKSKAGLVALQMAAEDMPGPEQILDRSGCPIEPYDKSISEFHQSVALHS